MNKKLCNFPYSVGKCNFVVELLKEELIMSSLELEAGKLELIREIVNINSSTALESLRKYMKEVLNKNSHSIPTAADSKLLTKRMLAKYAGSWKDNRDSDEINDDIYASRLSRKEENFSPFDE